jgi:hypothetical protein
MNSSLPVANLHVASASFDMFRSLIRRAGFVHPLVAVHESHHHGPCSSVLKKKDWRTCRGLFASRQSDRRGLSSRNLSIIDWVLGVVRRYCSVRSAILKSCFIPHERASPCHSHQHENMAPVCAKRLYGEIVILQNSSYLAGFARECVSSRPLVSRYAGPL